MKSVSKSIESGSNDKGYYRKSPDGTLECWIKKTVEFEVNVISGSSFYGIAGNYDFPCEFKELLYLNASLIADNYSASYFGVSNTTNKKTGTIFFLRTTKVTVTGRLLVYAVGTWK